jgi:hypothetical protein
MRAQFLVGGFALGVADLALAGVLPEKWVAGLAIAALILMAIGLIRVIAVAEGGD